jgi:hypothetical protein
MGELETESQSAIQPRPSIWTGPMPKLARPIEAQRCRNNLRSRHSKALRMGKPVVTAGFLLFGIRKDVKKRGRVIARRQISLREV